MSIVRETRAVVHSAAGGFGGCDLAPLLPLPRANEPAARVYAETCLGPWRRGPAERFPGLLNAMEPVDNRHKGAAAAEKQAKALAVAPVVAAAGEAVAAAEDAAGALALSGGGAQAAVASTSRTMTAVGSFGAWAKLVGELVAAARRVPRRREPLRCLLGRRPGAGPPRGARARAG